MVHMVGHFHSSLSGEAEDPVLKVALARRVAELQAWLHALSMPGGLGGTLIPLWLITRQLESEVRAVSHSELCAVSVFHKRQLCHHRAA